MVLSCQLPQLPGVGRREAREPLCWEAIAEHRQSANRFSLGRFVLKDVPVLGELAVLDADDVSGNPGRGAAVAREATVGVRSRQRERLGEADLLGGLGGKGE